MPFWFAFARDGCSPRKYIIGHFGLKIKWLRLLYRKVPPKGYQIWPASLELNFTSGNLCYSPSVVAVFSLFSWNQLVEKCLTITVETKCVLLQSAQYTLYKHGNLVVESNIGTNWKIRGYRWQNDIDWKGMSILDGYRRQTLDRWCIGYTSVGDTHNIEKMYNYVP